MIAVYLQALQGKVFKILPAYEENVEGSKRYMKLLHCELIGAANVIPALQSKIDFIDILSIVSFLASDNSYDFPTLKQLVFTAIECVKRLQSQITSEGEL